MSDLATLLRPTRDCHCATTRRAGRALTQLYDAALAESGLTIAQFTILSTVAQAGDPPLSKLAGLLGLERTTLTRNLAVLEKRRLVEASGEEDGRVRRIGLSALGETALRTAFPLWQAAQAEAEDALKRMRP